MPGKPRYTTRQVIAALEATKGMVFLAAKHLGCDPDTIQNYCRRHPSVEAAKVAARGELLDEAELRLWAAVRRDEAWAIGFCLKTLGRHRGYVERVDLTLKIDMVVQKVAASMGLDPQAVLLEAQTILREIDSDAHG